MTKHLAIIAGKGRMPLEVAHAAADDGYRPLVMPINGQADADFLGLNRPNQAWCYYHQGFAAGSWDKPVSFGWQVDWPSLRDLRPDQDGVKLLGKMLTRGDDKVLRLQGLFCRTRHSYYGVDRFMPSTRGRRAKAGDLPSSMALAAIAHGRAVLGALGDQDVGQSVVVQAGQVLAIEAAEGTDQMLKRVKLDKT